MKNIFWLNDLIVEELNQSPEWVAEMLIRNYEIICKNGQKSQRNLKIFRKLQLDRSAFFKLCLEYNLDRNTMRKIILGINDIIYEYLKKNMIIS